MIDYIIGGLLLALAAIIVIRMVRRSKKGGGCAGCTGCAAKRYDDVNDCCHHNAPEKK